MKKYFLMITIMIGGFLYNTASAQGFSVNISVQPIWGPVGFDHVDYYYFPDYEVYYNVPQHKFIYREGPDWVFAASLPARYGQFDLYRSYKVVINEPKPYLHHDVYREKYAMYKGHHDQQVIRDSHEQKYFVIKDHPEHGKYKATEHHDNHNDKHDDQHDNHKRK